MTHSTRAQWDQQAGNDVLETSMMMSQLVLGPAHHPFSAPFVLQELEELLELTAALLGRREVGSCDCQRICDCRRSCDGRERVTWYLIGSSFRPARTK